MKNRHIQLGITHYRWQCHPLPRLLSKCGWRWRIPRLTVKSNQASVEFVPSVMLVDDSPDDAFFFERALKKLCIKCAFNHLLDGAAAVRVLHEVFGDNGNGNSAGPDIIFLDLKMPVMSGFEFLEWLQRRSFRAGPSVFVLSGSDQDADRERAAELGAAGYLVKPITSERLRACLNTIKPTIQPPAITRPDSAGVERH